MSYQKLSDDINVLPFDQSNPTDTEMQIANSLFKENYSNVEKIMFGLKDVFVIGILFFVFSLPQLDEMIKGFYPYTATSVYALMFAKAILFMVAYFVIKNMYLVKKA
jgi:hypothetical protein